MSNGYCQGIFTPKYPQKYNGRHPIAYRSEPEKLLMAFADRNPRIVKWSSESIVVPYVKPTDGRVHRYFIDFTFELLENNGSISKYLIEYKPYKQVIEPKPSKRKKPQTFLTEQLNWAVNQAKWEAARGYAKKNGWKFMVVTERDLG